MLLIIVVVNNVVILNGRVLHAIFITILQIWRKLFGVIEIIDISSELKFNSSKYFLSEKHHLYQDWEFI